MYPTQPVLEVLNVNLSILKTFPPILHINALGIVPTPCYTNARLEPWIYVKPPADGIWDFDFVADEKPGICPQVLSPITADYFWRNYPHDLKGVRVHAKLNSLEKTLEDTKALVIKSLG